VQAQLSPRPRKQLEFSVAGGAAISGAITPTAATQAGAISALNTFFAQNASLAAAGLNATASGGQIQIASTNGTAFRINALGAANKLINKTAAESRIRDADLAAESANLTKANILLQAGVAALAQANSSPQQVLQLLRF
jgi:flagellin